jgi:hypothetical protein
MQQSVLGPFGSQPYGWVFFQPIEVSRFGLVPDAATAIAAWIRRDFPSTNPTKPEDQIALLFLDCLTTHP